MPRIDPRLPADGGIDLRQQRRRDLDEAHAAPDARGRKACEITDDAAAERDDEVIALHFGGDDIVAERGELRIRFR